MSDRECWTCSRTLPLTVEYFERNNTKAGFRVHCKECVSRQRREKYAANYFPGKYSDQSRYHYKWAGGRRYLTKEGREALWAQSGGVCAICSDEISPDHKPSDGRKNGHLDHCHETGEFRGWLCIQCNTSIGGFSESPYLLRRAADYIERSRLEQ